MFHSVALGCSHKTQCCFHEIEVEGREDPCYIAGDLDCFEVNIYRANKPLTKSGLMRKPDLV